MATIRWLKGRNRETGDEAITTESFDLLRSWHHAGQLVCPFCDGDMVTVHEYQRSAGNWVSFYLRHKAECTTAYGYHPQSPEHFAAKEWLRLNAPGAYGHDVVTNDPAQVIEVRIDIDGKAYRIADVCFTLANGDRVIHEAQLAAISIDELEARTNDYESLGYSVIWHFGKAADTGANRQWAFRRFGGCEIFQMEEQLIAA